MNSHELTWNELKQEQKTKSNNILITGYFIVFFLFTINIWIYNVITYY